MIWNPQSLNRNNNKHSNHNNREKKKAKQNRTKNPEPTMNWSKHKNNKRFLRVSAVTVFAHIVSQNPPQPP